MVNRIWYDKAEDLGCGTPMEAYYINGMKLHELYFENLGGNENKYYGRILNSLKADFGSVGDFEKNSRTPDRKRGDGQSLHLSRLTEDCMYTAWILMIRDAC